jgi:hypothetical protein
VTVALDLPSARLLADQATVVADLQFVMDCCKQLLTLLAADSGDSSVIPQALWSAALTAYARCFTQGKKTGLSTDDVRGLPLQGAVLKFHSWALEQQAGLASHPADPFAGARIGAALSGARVDGITILQASRILVDGIGVRQLGGLAAELAKLTAERATRQQDAVLADAQGLPPARLRALPELPVGRPDEEADSAASPA